MLKKLKPEKLVVRKTDITGQVFSFLNIPQKIFLFPVGLF